MGRKILGILAGLITDIALSLILGLIFGAAMAIFLMAHGVPTRDLISRVTACQQQPFVILAEEGLGSFGSIVGGFITGWIVRSHRVICGVLMGALSSLMALTTWNSEPLWSNILGMGLTLIMATCGAWLAEAFLGGTPRLPATGSQSPSPYSP